MVTITTIIITMITTIIMEMDEIPVTISYFIADIILINTPKFSKDMCSVYLVTSIFILFHKKWDGFILFS